MNPQPPNESQELTQPTPQTPSAADRILQVKAEIDAIITRFAKARDEALIAVESLESRLSASLHAAESTPDAEADPSASQNTNEEAHSHESFPRELTALTQDALANFDRELQSRLDGVGQKSRSLTETVFDELRETLDDRLSSSNETLDAFVQRAEEMEQRVSALDQQIESARLAAEGVGLSEIEALSTRVDGIHATVTAASAEASAIEPPPADEIRDAAERVAELEQRLEALRNGGSDEAVTILARRLEEIQADIERATTQADAIVVPDGDRIAAAASEIDRLEQRLETLVGKRIDQASQSIETEIHAAARSTAQSTAQSAIETATAEITQSAEAAVRSTHQRINAAVDRTVDELEGWLDRVRHDAGESLAGDVEKFLDTARQELTQVSNAAVVRVREAADRIPETLVAEVMEEVRSQIGDEVREVTQRYSSLHDEHLESPTTASNTPTEVSPVTEGTQAQDQATEGASHETTEELPKYASEQAVHQASEEPRTYPIEPALPEASDKTSRDACNAAAEVATEQVVEEATPATADQGLNATSLAHQIRERMRGTASNPAD